MHQKKELCVADNETYQINSRCFARKLKQTAALDSSWRFRGACFGVGRDLSESLEQTS